MNRIIAILMLWAFPILASAQIAVFPSEEKGPFKPVNSVNNGPKVSAFEGNRNAREYADARFPFARLHDSRFAEHYGGQFTVDISAIFPDFSKDENDPSSYEFIFTDRYISRILSTGTQVFFRLGQSIEHGPKKYFVNPPEDFGKWARICEHIIRHYNEGWAKGFRHNIRYWEIWNEFDCGRGGMKDQTAANKNLPCWTGTAAQFYDFYETAAKHLKKHFPNLMIGGPALAGTRFVEPFITEMAVRKVPMDFFSWHWYGIDPAKCIEKADKVRACLDANGYRETQSICSEWNYVINFKDANPASMEVVQSLKGAAFNAAVMIAAQNSSSLDMMHYYDARLSTRYNGLFSGEQGCVPLKGYYAYYAWSRLALLETQVEVKVDDERYQAIAAKSADGTIRLLVNRFTPDNNDLLPLACKVAVPEGYQAVDMHLTDKLRSYTETPVHFGKDGRLEVFLYPNAFALIEFKTNNYLWKQK